MTSAGRKSSITSDPASETYAQVYEGLIGKYRAHKPVPDMKCIENYYKEKGIVVEQPLAFGPNSVVYLGKRLTNSRLMALKIIFKRGVQQLGGSLIKRNIDYYKVHKSDKLSHVHEFTSINEGYMSLVTDYYPGGSLAKHLEVSGAMQETLVRNIFKLVLQGLCYLHICKIAHRNLKLENVLLDHRMMPVLADFSGSIVVEDNANWETMLATSLPYLAPEILSKIPYDPIISDIWSLGVCMYSCLNDSLPFGCSAKPRKPNSTVKFKPLVEQTLSESAKKCVKDALHFDVNKRATSFSLQNEPWFS